MAPIQSKLRGVVRARKKKKKLYGVLTGLLKKRVTAELLYLIVPRQTDSF